MQDGGVIPVTGFPTNWRQKRRTEQVTTRARCKHRVQLIQHMQTFTDGRLDGYTFEACERDGSSSSREVEEVVVHGSSREVVVLFRRGT